MNESRSLCPVSQAQIWTEGQPQICWQHASELVTHTSGLAYHNLINRVTLDQQFHLSGSFMCSGEEIINGYFIVAAWPKACIRKPGYLGSRPALLCISCVSLNKLFNLSVIHLQIGNYNPLPHRLLDRINMVSMNPLHRATPVSWQTYLKKKTQTMHSKQDDFSLNNSMGVFMYA